MAKNKKTKAAVPQEQPPNPTPVGRPDVVGTIKKLFGSGRNYTLRSHLYGRLCNAFRSADSPTTQLSGLAPNNAVQVLQKTLSVVQDEIKSLRKDLDEAARQIDEADQAADAEPATPPADQVEEKPQPAEPDK
jgi:hypothetical protein